MLRFLIILCVLICGLPLRADPVFEKQVRPILENRCFACHGLEKQKGKLRLDTLGLDLVKDRRAAETWHDVIDAINLGEMPPEEETQLTGPERNIIISWIEKNLELARGSAASLPRGTVMRRLNRAEYAYVMEDLLGFPMDYANSLPPDSFSRDGFLNNGAALSMSGMQLEAYLETARKALNFVLVEGTAPQKSTKVFSEKLKAKGKLPPGKAGYRLGRNHYWSGSISNMQRTGPFTIRITARAERNVNQPIPELEVEYGYFVGGLTTSFRDTLGRIPIEDTESQVYQLHGQSEFFPQPDATVPADKLNGVIVIYNALRDGIDPPKPTKQEVPETDDQKKKKRKKKKPILVYGEDPDFPKIIIEKVEIMENDYDAWPPAFHRNIVPEHSDLESESVVREIVNSFCRRAWRRPLTEAELDQWCNHFQDIRKQSDSSLAALREILALSLTSQHFLYLSEPQSPDTIRPLTSHELAARLSFFLWSSLPDETLSLLADQGKLTNLGQLKSEFDRLIDHPKSNRFVEQFTTQWLDLGGLDRVAINPQYYKGFDEDLKTLMAKESREFFNEILRNDRSALLFLKSDFTMANKLLASHYGLSGPRGNQFEMVSLKNTDRFGGLLGQAAVHMAGSDGAHSHPIKRAVWIRERLLHDPPKPPPPNVPTIEDSVPGFDKLTVREQLEVHRKKEACADCHRGIDPWGIALEEYDAIGLRRDRIANSKEAVDSKTELPGGFAIGGLADLEDFLVRERKDQFAHALVAKMMIYALGRSLTFEDESLIEEIAERFQKNDYRMKPMMKDIVTSSAFTHR